MECRGMGLTAVHYNTLNLYHCRENDARCIVRVGIGFSVVYRKRKKKSSSYQSYFTCFSFFVRLVVKASSQEIDLGMKC